MNVYSELFILLNETADPEPSAVFGVFAPAHSVAAALRGTRLTKGLFYPAGKLLRGGCHRSPLRLLPGFHAAALLDI